MIFKEAYEAFRKAILCDIVSKFGVLIKYIRAVKTCASENYSKILCINTCPILFLFSSEKMTRFIAITFQTFFASYHFGRRRGPKGPGGENEWKTASGVSLC